MTTSLPDSIALPLPGTTEFDRINTSARQGRIAFGAQWKSISWQQPKSLIPIQSARS